MPAFSYVAVDAQGRTRRGVVEAEAPRQARAGLRGGGLVAIELAPLGTEQAAPGLAGALRRRTRISAAELPLFTRRFALLLEAGLTVEECLDALVEQAEGGAAAQVLAAVRAEVIAGHGLAEAIARFPGSFPDVYRALVAAGEQSGMLAQVLGRLAEHLERAAAVRQGVGLALLYPAIVAVFALVIVAGLLAYVVPQVAEVYAQSKHGLPFLTRALLWLSGAMQALLPAFVAAVVLVAVMARAALRREQALARWQLWLLRLPVLGPIARAAETARFSSTLAVLVDAGVPLVPALGAAGRTLRYLPLRTAVEQAARRIREGGTLHAALAAEGRFPPLFLHLVASGEASGRLAQTLVQAGRQHEMESETRIRLLAGMLEPAMIIAMGVVVLLIVLAILAPIVQLNQLVR